MPVGYGNDFSGTNRVGEPLFQFGNFLYCKSRLQTDTQIGRILKVNMLTNEVLELTNLSPNPSYPVFQELYWDYGMQNLRNVKEVNGEIYFNGWQTTIYKINPTNNTLSHLTNVAYNYDILNNNLIPSSGYSIYNLNDLSQYYSPSVTIDGISYTIELGSPNLKVGNSVYSIGTLYNAAAPLHSSRRLFRLDNSSYPTIGLTTIYTFNSELGGIEGFSENGGYPYFINNTMIWKRIYFNTTTNQNEVCLSSFNLDTNTFNPILCSYDVVVGYQFFVNNNNLYIRNSSGQFLATNGTSAPVLTSIPIFYNGSGFCAGENQPAAGNYNDTPFIKFNNFLVGKDTGSTITTPAKIWKTDGASSNLQLISDNLNLSNAKVYNNNLYAHGYNHVSGNYNISKIYKFNDGNNTFQILWSFPNTGFGSLISHLFFYNNYVFFRVNANSSLPEGLYKLDLSTLSNQEFSNTKTIFSPNPTTSQITFSQEVSNLEIFDITGKKVKTFENSTTTYNVDNLEKGIYLLKGKNNEGIIFNEKLVKN